MQAEMKVTESFQKFRVLEKPLNFRFQLIGDKIEKSFE